MEGLASMDECDGDYLGSYRRFLDYFVANVCNHEDQLPVKMSRRDVRDCELAGEIVDITLQHLNQRICPPSLQAYLVKLVMNEFKMLFQKSPEECGYRPHDKAFSPLKLMQTVTNKVNEICQRYLDNSRLALLPPPPSTPLPLATSYAIKNRRRKMEDRSVVLHDLHTMYSIKNDSVVNYYAVFDGHGGQEAATYCAAHLHQYLVESPYYPLQPELALRDAFHTTDKRFIEGDDAKNSGATAVCALLYDKTLYVAWAGDSQAALVKNGRGINLTIPHKPERPDEKKRIEDLDGKVVHYGTWRVNGVLDVSRSIGDALHKPWVSGDPDIKRIDLDGTEDFLVIACDGFWERATDDIVASLLYEYVSSRQCEYSTASEALVAWAKQNLSEDNISVIVVFLTPPAEIAAKRYFSPTNNLQPVSMEQSGGMEHEHQQQSYDLDFGFGKPTGITTQNTNGDEFSNSLLEPMNGRHRPKPPKYNDEDDDEDEEDEEDDDEDDFGPETNVDAVDDSHDFVKLDQNLENKLDQAMANNCNDEFFIKASAKIDDAAEFPPELKGEPRNDADNVGDSEDSDDEWNYYRPNEGNSEDRGGGVNNSGKDPSLVEKPDCAQEEKETCSPKPQEEEDSSPLSQPPSQASIEPDEDVTAEIDDDIKAEQVLHFERQFVDDRLDFDKNQEEEKEKQKLEDSDFELDKEQPALLQPSNLLNEKDTEAEAACNLNQDLSTETLQKEEYPPEYQESQGIQQNDYQDQEDSEFNNLENIAEESDDNMDSHLNPDAAEFVPTSPLSSTSPMIPQLMDNDLVAGSPLKQSQRALKNRKIPSEEEFQKEICRRPSEINDSVSSELSNGESSPSPTKNPFGISYHDENDKPRAHAFLDESEISSTKAEFGDESTANFSMASEFCKTGISNIDVSFNERDDVMNTSMTPSDFKTAFANEPDLNKVHELQDDDLMIEVHNGLTTVQESPEEKMNKSANWEEDGNNRDMELDMDNFYPQQEKSKDLFSAVVDERESESSEMFSKSRCDEDISFEENNKIDDQQGQQVLQQQLTENNPFSLDFASNNDINMQNIVDDMQNVKIDNQPEREQMLFEDVPKESPQMMLGSESMTVSKELTYDQVMHNPLDLNFGGASAEQKLDEPVLVSPIKEPEVMSSKYAEEDLMSKSAHDDFSPPQNIKAEDIDLFMCEKAPAAFPEFGISSNLKQEFTEIKKEFNEEIKQEIKEELNSEILQEFNEKVKEEFNEEVKQEFNYEIKEEVNQEIKEEAPILKENLVEEQKDVEEIKPSAPPEPTIEETPMVTNETPAEVVLAELAPTSVGLAEVAATAAVATAVAAATASTATATAKIATKPAGTTAKPSKTTATTKPVTKSTTPTSPTKTSTTSKPLAAKKATPASAPRPKSAITNTNATSKPSAGAPKSTAPIKSTASAKTTNTATKAALRTTTTAASTKPKPLTSTTSKVSSSADKKPLANGDVKAAPKSSTAPKTKAATGTSAPKVGLVKSSTTTKTTSNATAASKTRPTSATNSTTAPKPRMSLTTGASTTSTLNSRPKTAPISSTAAKPKTTSMPKSPMIDKQIKETANKQARSATSTVAAKPRLSSVTPTSNKRASLASSKPANTSSSPAKKAPVQVSKPGPIKLNNVQSKINSRVSSATTKTNSTTTQQKIVQNGVIDEAKIEETNTTTTTTTTNIDGDVPKKDVSPIEPITDNQLITAE